MDLLRLYAEGQITKDEALANSDSVNNLRLKIKMYDAAKSAESTPPAASEERPDTAPVEAEPLAAKPVADEKKSFSLSLELTDDEIEQAKHEEAEESAPGGVWTPQLPTDE